MPDAETSPDAPADPQRRPPADLRQLLPTFAGGLLMGAADVVPGVSGGTIALVLGIYEPLVAQVRVGAGALGALARADLRGAVVALRRLRLTFLLPLGLGIVTSVLALASALEHLLDTRPTQLSALFFGLVAGSAVIGARLLKRPAARHGAIGLASAVVTFLVLGLRSGQVHDPSLPIVAAAGAVAICAMILPGISGSFILLLLGMYETVIGAVGDRDLVIAAVFIAGAVVGLAAFSTFLEWLLEHHHDLVLAVLVGLMVGSLRVLWPWPAGADGVGDTTLGAPVGGEVAGALGLGAVGFALVLGVAWFGTRIEAPETPPAVG